MALTKQITAGNLITWALLLISVVTSYVKLQGSAEAANATAFEAKSMANAAQMQVNDVHTSVEVIKERVISIDKRLDDFSKSRGFERLSKNNE